MANSEKSVVDRLKERMTEEEQNLKLGFDKVLEKYTKEDENLDKEFYKKIKSLVLVYGLVVSSVFTMKNSDHLSNIQKLEALKAKMSNNEEYVRCYNEVLENANEIEQGLYHDVEITQKIMRRINK